MFPHSRAVYGQYHVRRRLQAGKPVENVPEIVSRPVLFIHGEEDDFSPLGHAYRLYEASQNPDDMLWIVPGADHVKAYMTSPTEYLDKVIAFSITH